MFDILLHTYSSLWEGRRERESHGEEGGGGGGGEKRRESIMIYFDKSSN